MSGKKSILKKALSVSLSAAMIYSTAAFAEAVGFVGENIGSITASAATETPASSFRYEANSDGGIIITKFTGSETEVVIPSQIGGKPVTSIGYEAFCDCTGLTSVIIPDNVTSLGWLAFRGCTGLTSVTIPDSVTYIGTTAFYSCTGLTNITIPDSVTSIGERAFEDTEWYNSQPYGLVYAGKVAYKYKGDMPRNTSITLADGTKGIASEAFEDCTGLVSITIPNSVTNIGDDAFSSCTSLISITIPDSVTSIGDYAFSNCEGLTSITIPDSVTSIGIGALNNTEWYNLQPDGLVYAGKVAYKYKGEWINNMDGYVDGYGYVDMPENTSIVLAEGTKGIAGDAFYYCTRLTSITIPDSVTSIDYYAFYGCTGLTNVTIPDSVTSIGDRAFSGCTGLTSITIPDSVTSIGYGAFSGCTGLTAINIGEGNTSYSSVDGVFFNKDKTSLICYPSGKADTTYTIPDSVLGIENVAFQRCTGLTSVTIPYGITSIGGSAFFDCTGLTGVTIPDSVTYIKDCAFGYYLDYGFENKIDGFTIFGKTGSAAEAYANENGFEFVSTGHEHTPGEATRENEKPATCTEPGSYDEVVKCTVCGEEISRETKTVPATGHNWGEWKVEGNKEVRTCKNDPNHKETRDIEVSSVKLDKTSLTLEAGKTQKLAATITPSNATNKTLTWTSSKKNVATVSNGTVKAVKAGTATVTVKTANGKTATCKVTVKAANVAVKSVKLNKTSLTLNKGKTSTLKATLNPTNATDKKLTWTTSNKKVATVDSKGKVKAVGKGSAIITVKSANGKKATCKVAVKVPATKVKLNKTKATLKVGKTLTLKATKTPSGSTDKLTWTTSNKKVATVKNGKVTAKKAGNVTITVKTTSGKTAKCKITVKKK